MYSKSAEFEKKTTNKMYPNHFENRNKVSYVIMSASHIM